jgi:hypothetical protein
LDYQQKLDLINLCLEHKDRFTAGHFTDFYTFIAQAYEFHYNVRCDVAHHLRTLENDLKVSDSSGAQITATDTSA